MNLVHPSSPSFFAYIVAKLGSTGIPYMVTGSMGCTLYGDPRSTNDVDIVIDPTLEQLSAALLDLDYLKYWGAELNLLPRLKEILGATNSTISLD